MLWSQLVEVEWLLLLTIQSSHSWKTMHGMLCVHVLIFVMLAFFYCLAAFQNIPDSNRAINSHRGNSPLPSVRLASAWWKLGFKFRLLEIKTWRGQDSNLQSSDHEPDELTNYSTPLLPLLFLFFHYSHLGPRLWLLGRDRTNSFVFTSFLYIYRSIPTIFRYFIPKKGSCWAPSCFISIKPTQQDIP